MVIHTFRFAAAGTSSPVIRSSVASLFAVYFRSAGMGPPAARENEGVGRKRAVMAVPEFFLWLCQTWRLFGPDTFCVPRMMSLSPLLSSPRSVDVIARARLVEPTLTTVKFTLELEMSPNSTYNELSGRTMRFVMRFGVDDE